jgi:hypothetical protein
MWRWRSAVIKAARSSTVIADRCSLMRLSGAGSWLNGGGRSDPELNDYVGSAGTPSPSASG